jgi:site-specific recombinase XerD
VAQTRNGVAWKEFGLRHAFRRACVRAKVTKAWRFHDLRHAFVTRLFRSGAPANVVQQLAGHLELTTTQRYAHTAAADLAAAIARLT